MLTSIFHWILSAIAVLLTAKVIPGFKVSHFFSALIAALVIALVTNLLGPLLVFLTLPLTLITLGLFLFVVNAILLKISAAFVPGFEVDGWMPAIFGALILSIFNLILHSVFV